MSYMPIKETAYALKEYYAHAEDTEKVILNAALVAAGADAVGGAIPGASIPITIITCTGAVWVMYGALCKTLGISLKKNVLKLLARAALANIVANLGGSIAALLAGMMVPGASVVASAVVAFLTVYLAGMVFLKLVLKLAKQSNNPYDLSGISADDMKRTMKDIPVSGEDLEAARRVYEANRGRQG